MGAILSKLQRFYAGATQGDSQAKGAVPLSDQSIAVETKVETTSIAERPTHEQQHPQQHGETTTPSNPDSPTIAIIGGGIIGLITALGLIHRGISVTVYERSSKFTETSAGFSFSSGAREAMSLVSPAVLRALMRVAAPNEYPFIRYFDGFTKGAQGNGEGEKPSWQIPADKPDYYGCLRAAFLENLGREIPEHIVKFGKILEGYVDDEVKGKVVLRFTDESVEEVDAVIGCDGIKSRTRQIMLGEDDPAAYPGFTHMVAYRALLPIEGVLAALGEDKGHSHCLHVGPGAYTVTYPVANNTLVNTILFCKMRCEWPDSSRMAEQCYREKAQEALKDWKGDIRGVIDLLPDRPAKWAIFDMSEHPAKTYTSGRVCVAGDAAHASTPFLASGAAMGVEDAAVLTTTLDTALKNIKLGSTTEKSAAIRAAFQAYSNARLQRSQTTVRDSRAVGDVCMWQNPETGQDPDKCFAEIWASYSRVWEFDVHNMVEKAKQECLHLLMGMPAKP
ncbi:FAD-dependent oxidoreductase [Aspergillus stella-maris]|uniref:FAD-dependent oxidoreductase n=1 Tax=Aspergillus stella-maris TaxID=1810926 RepID=UPI003CCCD03C